MMGQELNPLWLTCIGKKQDISVWKIIAQDALIMNIDDLLCVGATNILLSSTIGRNKT
jgi:phosphoribosylaminoimidazole (AIR) synthetase